MLVFKHSLPLLASFGLLRYSNHRMTACNECDCKAAQGALGAGLDTVLYVAKATSTRTEYHPMPHPHPHTSESCQRQPKWRGHI